MRNKEALRILFNNSHANLPSSKNIPQGGPASFAKAFSDNMNKHSDIELISLVFSHLPKDNSVHIKKTEKNGTFFELCYRKEILLESYKKDSTKASYIKFLEPFLLQLDSTLRDSKPDLIFLNGFNVSNWLILESAYRNKIPVCIQHAGLWKKEIQMAGKAFSPSIKRIFSSFEKEIIKKSTHQIFLNKFSQDEFFSIHNIPTSKIPNSKISIVPLPINISKVKKMHLLDKPKQNYKIGVVARWDKIKNHSAVYRLATFAKKKSIPLTISVVTKWETNVLSKFKDKYEKAVDIVSPIHPAKLLEFYEKQDIVIIPSRFDVSPTVLMESVLCGKPVIISNNVGWFSDYKKFGLTECIISASAGGEDIIGALDNLFKNKEKILPKFTNLQKKITSEHNYKSVFGQYYKIFKKISYESKK